MKIEPIYSMLKQDDDGHWYLIPENEEEHFDEWIENPRGKYDYDEFKIDSPKNIRIIDYIEV